MELRSRGMGHLENFPKEVESAVSLSTSMVSAPLYNGSVRLDDRKIAADSLFFRTMVSTS